MELGTFDCFKLIILFLLATFGLSEAKVQYKVKCSDDEMVVELVKTEDIEAIYLESLRFYPDKACQPTIEGSKATFILSLLNIHRCGVTRVSNQITGKRVYYHRIVVEPVDTNQMKEYLMVKCVIASSALNHTISKRNVLPAGFQEPEDLEITTSLTERAPEPMLNVGVRQGKEMISGELNVNPGTPLTMEIYLDKSSAPIYGVLVSYMQVTDTKQQEETIIFNGCSVDPYLFENFNTVDGDFLSAKFRAFKFPDSTYVLFKGTVNVCLDKCRGVDCSNGQIGYGRKRRAVPSMPPDPNKVFEVSLTTFIRVNSGDKTLEQLKTEEYITQSKNSTKNLFAMKDGLNPTELEEEHDMISSHNGVEEINKLRIASQTIKEETKFAVIEEQTNSSNLTGFNLGLLLILMTFILNC